MSKETTATFIGHKECYGVQACDIREEIIKLIEMGITDFLNGGMGHFDWMCAKIVFDLKKDYPDAFGAEASGGTGSHVNPAKKTGDDGENRGSRLAKQNKPSVKSSYFKH